MKFETMKLSTLATLLSGTVALSGIGDMTYYASTWQPGTKRACGIKAPINPDFYVAMNRPDFTSLGASKWTSDGQNNLNPICGQCIKVTFGGKSVIVQIEDECPECAKGAIDMSEAAFTSLVPKVVGRNHGTSWTSVPCPSTPQGFGPVSGGQDTPPTRNQGSGNPPARPPAQPQGQPSSRQRTTGGPTSTPAKSLTTSPKSLKCKNKTSRRRK